LGLAALHDEDQVFVRIFQQLDVSKRITRQPAAGYRKPSLVRNQPLA
jgi:hypothetical protein